MGELGEGGSAALAVTCDVIHEFFYLNILLPFLFVSVCFCIGAIIRTHQDILCLPYARYFDEIIGRVNLSIFPSPFNNCSCSCTICHG